MDLANFWTEKVNEHTWKHCVGIITTHLQMPQ